MIGGVLLYMWPCIIRKSGPLSPACDKITFIHTYVYVLFDFNFSISDKVILVVGHVVGQGSPNQF